MKRIRCIDSHTGGEPTRVVLSGFPELGQMPLAQVVQALRAQHDRFRRATVCEPRGSDVVVGALLLEPRTPGALASVVFFNNVGYLGMCGHGTIGLMATLEYLGRVTAGRYTLDTPVGAVRVELRGKGVVAIENVPAYRHLAGVELDVPGHGRVRGDVAWGGNWFFLCDAGALALDLASVHALTDRAWAIRRALAHAGVTGRDGAEIDHIELMGPAHGDSPHAVHGGPVPLGSGPAETREHLRPAGSGAVRLGSGLAAHDPAAGGRNFVLCPGGAYDRSPCGTGTSAKLACLAADGKLAPGAPWRQESVLGSVFEASYRIHDGRLIPTIRGQAHVCAELELLIDEADPYAWGVV